MFTHFASPTLYTIQTSRYFLCFWYDREHYEVADTLRTFLELDQPTQQVQDTDDYLGDGSSSDDSFEQVDRMDLEADLDLDLDPPTAPSPQ